MLTFVLLLSSATVGVGDAEDLKGRWTLGASQSRSDEEIPRILSGPVAERRSIQPEMPRPGARLVLERRFSRSSNLPISHPIVLGRSCVFPLN
jgi:hypothetical protein